MLCLDDEIDQALKGDAVLIGLLGGELIYEYSEPGILPYPRVIYEDISNVPDFEADDIEFASRITYRISVCSESNLIGIINAVERVMISNGFIRGNPEPIHGLPSDIKGKVILFTTVREC